MSRRKYQDTVHPPHTHNCLSEPLINPGIAWQAGGGGDRGRRGQKRRQLLPRSHRKPQFLTDFLRQPCWPPYSRHPVSSVSPSQEQVCPQTVHRSGPDSSHRKPLSTFSIKFGLKYFLPKQKRDTCAFIKTSSALKSNQPVTEAAGAPISLLRSSPLPAG